MCAAHTVVETPAVLACKDGHDQSCHDAIQRKDKTSNRPQGITIPVLTAIVMKVMRKQKL
eukprot:scaffold55127_cov29-Prasinocladus_malaysianus.AAC.3